MIVTIDGPAGTGKSTVARRLAEDLNFAYLDTGAMYRMVAWAVVDAGCQPWDQTNVERIVHTVSLRFASDRSFLNERDVTDFLRCPKVTEAASLVARVPDVRAVLTRHQQEIAAEGDYVCEGRDQGTVVFPAAECKFFLTADPEIRARRRLDELLGRGAEVDFDTLLREQTERDRRDVERTHSPLLPASDAIIVDTSSLSLEDVVLQLRSHVEERRTS